MSKGRVGTRESQDKPHVHLTNVLNISWCFGTNQNVPILNVSNSNRKEALFYTAAHTGVLHDFETNTQILYQGHQNDISCSCVSHDKRWIGTADIGRHNMLIVWDTKENIPVKTVFDVNSSGTQCMAISADSKYIALLSCDMPQTLTIWNWTLNSNEKVVSVNLDESLGFMTYLCFGSEGSNDLLCNNTSRLMFVKWDLSGSTEISTPLLTDEDFNKVVGSYSQSVFHPNGMQAFTGTSCGNMVVWSNVKVTWSAFKIIKLQEKAITVLKLWKDYLVIGDVATCVKIFDLNLKIINWYNKFGAEGGINSISFTFSPLSQKPKSDTPQYPPSALPQALSVAVDDFAVGTCKANFFYFQTEKNLVKHLQREIEKDIYATTCHPKRPLIAIAGFDGLLKIIDFETKTLIHWKQFDLCVAITCLTYHPSGDLLAVGFQDGHLQILDSVTLNVEEDSETTFSFDYSRLSIKKIVFANDGKHMACADDDRCVAVYRMDQNGSWCFLGKHRSHYKQVNDLCFTVALDEASNRLFSIGEDRILIEYDLQTSSLYDLKILTSTRIEQDAVPLSISPYPPITKEDFLIINNDKFKFKLFNSTTKMCRQTVLGPTFGAPVQRALVLPLLAESTNRYMAYITTNMVGLMKLPIDGNPHKTVALIAHPGQATNITCSYDGKHVFTCGGRDTSVLMWDIDYCALEASVTLGGVEMSPFYSLLDGGRDGELFKEMEEYFYYCQLRDQGLDSMETRKVSTSIPLKEIPFLMRALGFYPTEQEIEEMIQEVRFSEFAESGKYVEKIDLCGFVRLYINHRPAFGLQPSQIKHAFRNLSDDGSGRVDTGRLLNLLQEKGEHLSEAEMAECMSLLLEQYNKVPGTGGLPESLTAETFASEVLGFVA